MPTNFLEELASEPQAKNANFLEELAADQSAPVTEEDKPVDHSGFLDPEGWRRSVALMGRGAAKGLLSIPAIPMDLGVGTRNIVGNLINKVRGKPATPDYELPSATLERDLNTIFGKPESTTEKIASFAMSVLGGAGYPNPTVGAPVPANFVRPSASPVASTLKESVDAGYVVPPATANPSLLNKALEGATGKISTAQAASSKNQSVTNALVRKALGMAEDAPITSEALESIRATAGKVYERISKAGEIAVDPQYVDDLASLGRSADDIAKSFPGANVGATKQINELVDSLLQDKFDSKAALQYLRELRKMASGNLSGMNAADPAKQALGMAQREAASTLEDMIGRHLEKIGQKDLADAFSGARKIIAQTHTVEKALNEATGNVVAGKLGQQLAKGKPLTGELEIAAKFAQAFPKAAKEVTESMPGISPLDIYAAVGGGLISGQPWMAAIPATRLGLRELLLSSPWQKLAPGQGVLKAPPATLGLAPSAAIQLATED